MKYVLSCKLSTENAREYAVTRVKINSIGLTDIFLVMALSCLWKLSTTSFLREMSIVMVLILWHRHRSSYVVEESILAIRDIGIQVKTVYANRRERSQFIEQSKLADILIHEGIALQRILYYMMVVIKDEKETVVVFENTLPRLTCILKAYRGVRSIMYGEPEEDTETCLKNFEIDQSRQ